jgi:hypothetical protein
MEDLITNVSVLFDEHSANSASSPPLPPTPAGEPVPQLTYGSKTTKISVTEGASEDFTPPLPPRPNNSIHPSARANPQLSPTKIRHERTGSATADSLRPETDSALSSVPESPPTKAVPASPLTTSSSLPSIGETTQDAEASVPVVPNSISE